MKAYKLEILVINHDLVPEDEIKYHIENVRYPNRCLSPIVMDMKEADIGEWDDDHPLNQKATFLAEYQRLFKQD